MADASGKNIGDPGYDSTSDPLSINYKPGKVSPEDEASNWVKAHPGASLTVGSNTYTSDANGNVTTTPKGPTVTARGTLNWQKQTNADGSVYFARTNEQGQNEYMQPDGSPTTLLNAAYVVPKNVTEVKPLKYGSAGTAYVIQDPSKGGKTLYQTTDGSYTDDSNAANIKVDGPQDEPVESGPNAGLVKHTDAKTGTVTFIPPNIQGGSSTAPASGGVAANPAETQPGTGTVTPGQVSAATLPLDLAKAKQALQGDTVTKLQQISAGIKSGQIGLDDGIQLMDQTAAAAAGNYLDASQRATVLSNYNQQQVDQATKMAQTGATFTNDVESRMNDAAQHGASAAGPLANSLLASGPAILKSFGGGPANIQNPLAMMNVNMANGLQNESFFNQMKLRQPVTAEQQTRIKGLIGSGMDPKDAFLQVANKNGIDTTNHGVPSIPGVTVAAPTSTVTANGGAIGVNAGGPGASAAGGM